MKKERDCEWKNFCTKCEEQKGKVCSMCPWYRAIDSGYGYCAAPPKPIVVAWCKDPCYFYNKP